VVSSDRTASTIFAQLRLLQIMRALDLAGACPVSLSAMHSFVYFADVLSPLWNLPPHDNGVLKNTRGPFYPSIQKQIDILIAAGTITVERFHYEEIQNGRAWLEAQISLPISVSEELDGLVNAFPDDRERFPFLCELALAFSEIRPDKQDDAALVDATYSDPRFNTNRIIELSGQKNGRSKTATLQVTDKFQDFADSNEPLTKAQKLLLYMRLMKRRAYG
jgi:hypothetical protein